MLRPGLRRRVRNHGSLAGQHLNAAIVVSRHLVMQRTNDRKFFSNLCLQRHVFADIDPGHIGGNRMQRPSIITGSIRFHIPRFQLTGTTPHPKQNHRGITIRRSGSGPKLQQSRQRDSAQCKRSQPHKLTSSHRSAAAWLIHLTSLAVSDNQSGRCGSRLSMLLDHDRSTVFIQGAYPTTTSPPTAIHSFIRPSHITCTEDICFSGMSRFASFSSRVAHRYRKNLVRRHSVGYIVLRRPGLVDPERERRIKSNAIL